MAAGVSSHINLTIPQSDYHVRECRGAPIHEGSSVSYGQSTVNYVSNSSHQDMLRPRGSRRPCLRSALAVLPLIAPVHYSVSIVVVAVVALVPAAAISGN